MGKRYLTNLEKEKLGRNYIVKIYKKEKGIDLVLPGSREYGFDLKTPDGEEIIELKVSTSGTPIVRTFNVTKREYEKAQECIKNGITYNFIAVYNVESDSPYHRIFPAQTVIPNRIKPNMQYKIYIKAGEIEKFKK